MKPSAQTIVDRSVRAAVATGNLRIELGIGAGRAVSMLVAWPAQITIQVAPAEVRDRVCGR
ncbi:hypothetical protein FMUAM8_22260 [Nocardia cyriacigeorgica]|uniref:Uncharacterized protein n=1 Tax=Nocardia cyriacigeorgica (strain GUH-2) TaxID=1127134 RepID=H6QZ95_NOCCG|nr:hypothetical protein FMUAM8_22260 [Nocardia cyriacigeorgica]CCF62849.1 protein of unknown function [Nocardia cyriacigeorgica GUH-2]